MILDSLFSTVFLLSVLALALRTGQRKRDSRIIFLGLLSGLLASMEVLIIIPRSRVWVVGLWGLFSFVAGVFLLVLIRRHRSVSPKRTCLVALGYPFLVVAGVSILSRYPSQGFDGQYLAGSMGLLAFTAALILDQVMRDCDSIRAELIRQKEFSERLVDSSHDGIFRVNRDDRIILWNPAMELISGTASSAAIGASPSQALKHIFPGNGINPITEAFLGVEIAREWRVRSFSMPGTERVFKGYFSPVRKPVGEVVEVFAVITEVQENGGQRARLETEGIAFPPEAAQNHRFAPLSPLVPAEISTSVRKRILHHDGTEY